MHRAGALASALLLASCAPKQVYAQAVPWATTLAPAVDAVPLPEDRGADGLAQTLNKLRTWASLMMIVAHPDDEDGGMMAYESRGAGVRTSLMTLTRGEGGQNAMGTEAYDALGLLRTNELLAADRYAGTEQIWGSVADYGFSKTKEEAFAQWGRERVLRDVVRAVREQRPLVLTSVFLGGITDGHGHHQVAGELAQEAFNAAGDPTVFPDQIAAGLRPWKPLAVFARVPFAPVTAKGMYDYATDTWGPTSFTNYVSGEHSAAPPSEDIVIHEGQWDPALGRSYLQMAREGWGLQKSQNGGGTPPLAGPDDVAYHRYGTRVAAASNERGGSGTSVGFFTGIDTTLPGMAVLARSAGAGGDTAFVAAGLTRIDRAVTRAFWGYTPAVPGRIAPDLRDGYLAAQALVAAVAASTLTPDSKADLEHELGIKLVQFNTALVEALGLHLDALVAPTPARGLNGAAPQSLGLLPEVTRTHVTPGESFAVRLRVTAASPWVPGAGPGTGAGAGGLTLLRTGLDTPSGSLGASPTAPPAAQSESTAQAKVHPWEVIRIASPGTRGDASSARETLFQVTVPRDAAPTAPYFSRPSIEQAVYNVEDPSLAGQSFAPYPVSGYAEFDYNGVPLRLAEVVQGVERQPGLGTSMTPLAVVPGFSVNLSQHIAVLPVGARSLTVEAAVTNEQPEAADFTLQLDSRQGWRTPPPVHGHLQPGERVTEALPVELPPSAAAPASGNRVGDPPTGATGQMTVRVVSGNMVYSAGFLTAGYPGLRPYNLYRPATLEVRSVDVRVAPGARVGYVMGTGDEVPAALRALGVPVDMLTAGDLLTRDLHAYTTVMLGVRTYTAEPALARAGGVLQQFAAAGGTVVVQYQSADFPGAPFSLHLLGPGGGAPARVVDERAPVTLLVPQSPLLAAPNRITADDFAGWVEERGHGFAASWAPEWTPLVSMADPGQEPQRGGLLVAPVGRGRYIYSALALYRQLPEGVPGAYRLLANLIGTGGVQ